MKLVVLAPHFAPDSGATTGVVTRLVEELAGRGHVLDVTTSFPWYEKHAVEETYRGKVVEREATEWGRITRVYPFPTQDKSDILRRGMAYVGFSGLAGVLAAGWTKADGVLALSPPPTLGMAGWAVARMRRCPLVFNVQDVHPDVPIVTGMVRNPTAIRVLARLERWIYDRSDAVTVLSPDLAANVGDKIRDRSKVRVIPNFADPQGIVPSDRENSYRSDHGLGGKTVVMYAGNVGVSQPLGLMVEAAAALAHEDELVFVVNGGGAARGELERAARGLDNMVIVDPQPGDRISEVYAAADVHVVALKKGLAHASVPSKTYSILAAARPLIASIDPGTEIPRIVEESGAGVAVPPEDPEAFTKAVRTFLERPDRGAAMGEAGRRWVERWPRAADVAEDYERLFEDLIARRR